MNRMLFICPFILAILGYSCGGEIPNPFAKPSPIDPCDPTSSVYEGEKHYIERDFVKEDGTLDMERWFEAKSVQSSPCDPLKGESPDVNIPHSRPDVDSLENTLR